MTYEEELLARETAANNLEKKNNNARALLDLFTKRRDLVSCIANEKLLLAHLGGYPASLAILEDAIDNHRELRSQLLWQTPEQDRATLEASITKLLAGSPSAIKSETSKFRYKTISELAVWHDELVARKQAREATPQQLRTVLKNANAQAPSELPAEYTRERLIKMPASELRSLVSHYSTNLINARLRN